MASKPIVANARFANTGGADVAAPSSGLRDTGFVSATLIVQSLVNYMFNQFYQWALYLSDGALSGDHSINGALLVGKQTLVVVATVFTADNTTEIFTAAAHGLQTGDGPVRVANSAGALPTGLVAATDYWVIRIDANTFKLATTFLNAIAGTFLLISTNGTGTQTIFSTGATVRPTDLEVSRNLTVDGNLTVTGALAHGLVTENISPSIGYPQSGGPGTPVSGGVQGVDLDWVVPITRKIGDRLLAVRVVVNNAFGLTYIATLEGTVSAPATGAPVTTTIGTGGTGPLTGTLEALLINGLSHTVVANEVIELKLNKVLGGGFTSHYYTVEVDYDHPAP